MYCKSKYKILKYTHTLEHRQTVAVPLPIAARYLKGIQHFKMVVYQALLFWGTKKARWCHIMALHYVLQVLFTV